MAKYKQVSIKEVDLKKLRDRKGLSLRALGVKSGVSFRYIYQVENNLYVMTEKTWSKIKKALDETLDK